MLIDESRECIDALTQTVHSIVALYKSWNIDVVKYKISREVHLYTLLYLAYKVYNKEFESVDIVNKLNLFFSELRATGESSQNKLIGEYYNSTQSGSKSLNQRDKRYRALKDYILQ